MYISATKKILIPDLLNEYTPEQAEKIEQVVSGLRHLLSASELNDFKAAIQQEPVLSVRRHPLRYHLAANTHPVPWCAWGEYLSERPVFTLDPLFHAGAYYVQEAGSMFLHHVMQQILPQHEVRILDLCAAPGGKSTLMALSLRENDLLIANEVSRPRCSVLRENIIRHGDPKIIVSNNEASDFSSFNGFFDIILIDAPCSGEGMFRKDENALEEWSVDNVKQCAVRQKNIIGEILPALRDGGILIYSTCTYNAEENEKQLEYCVQEFSLENVAMDVPEEWNILRTKTSGIDAYRFLPHRTKAEGFFLSVMRKPGNEPHLHLPREKSSSTKKAEELKSWLRPEWEYALYMENEKAFIHANARETAFLKKHLRFALEKYPLAEKKGKDWIPAPEAVFSAAFHSENFQQLELEKEEALRYLKTEDISTKGEIGWNLITYQQLPLGWIKQLPNRSNNYYPKEWKIRMQLK